MAAVNATTLGDFSLRAYGLAERALDAAGLASEPVERQRWMQALASAGDICAELGDETAYARWVSAVLPLNTSHYAALTLADPRYAAAKNSKPPRKLTSHLTTFDCVSCDKCLPVCPNTALFAYATPVAAGLSLKENHQIAVFAAACNDCGNCDVFCPEHGGPYAAKPRMHSDIKQFYREAPRDGVWLAADGRHALGRIGGVNAEVVALESGWRISALATDGAVVDTTLKVVDSLGLAGLGTSEAAQAGRELLWIALGVADPERSNYLNTRLDINA
jgi:putative selenate reductase